MCRQAGVEEIDAGDGSWSIRLKLDLTANEVGAVALFPVEAVEPDGPYTFLSQWVGVFHRAAEAGAPSYVEEGQFVDEGDIVGVIAAMQLQHEVRVNRAGKLERFLIHDSTAVEYGQPMLELS
jgi:acetyl-CoA carboxylase biotin carboxyl carrier protein